MTDRETARLAARVNELEIALLYLQRTVERLEKELNELRKC
jgi:prefoldin subunit 5